MNPNLEVYSHNGLIFQITRTYRRSANYELCTLQVLRPAPRTLVNVPRLPDWRPATLVERAGLLPLEAEPPSV